ncbi:MAG: TRAP transporter small permease [Lachnospiraceae bacterium]|nr:TRAP transporter small permease [Lachnospiraceae bacterium]
MILLNKFVFWCNKIIGVIGCLVLSAIMLLITAGIISRYFFNSPFSWTEEVTTFLMVYLCYISAALTTVAKKHIVADFFIGKAPEKFQKAVSYFSRGLMLLFFLVVCISVAKLIPQLTWTSAVLEIPRKYYYLPVFSMCAFMFAAVSVDILNDIFPGYDIISQENARIQEEERQKEQEEAEVIQKNMDAFLESSGVVFSQKEESEKS